MNSVITPTYAAILIAITMTFTGSALAADPEISLSAVILDFANPVVSQNHPS